MIVTIIIFILTLLVLVVSHEFGHFMAAKKAGVKVLEFGFGLPPRVFGKRWGETLISLNWLPIGGFVKLLGEDETEKKVLDNQRSFAAQHVWKRIGIVVAGVTMNFLLAVVIFWIVLISQGFKETIPLLTTYNFIGVDQTIKTVVYVGAVAKDSPAEISGVKMGDRITAINGVEINSSEQLINSTKQLAGQQITLTILSPEDQIAKVTVTPRLQPPAGQGPLGVELGGVSVAELTYATPWQKLASGVTRSINFTGYSFKILGDLIGTSIKTKDLAPVSQTVSGPVGITQVSNTILQTKSPFIPYLNFVGLLSLNLAIINILPIPALDGGRLLFLLVEAVFRKKVRAEVEKWVHTVGMVLLLALIVLVTFSDIRKLFP